MCQIYFRFGNQYETPLLIQSIVMNLSMLAIVQLCVNVKHSKQIIRGKDKLFLGKQQSLNCIILITMRWVWNHAFDEIGFKRID